MYPIQLGMYIRDTRIGLKWYGFLWNAHVMVVDIAYNDAKHTDARRIVNPIGGKRIKVRV